MAQFLNESASTVSMADHQEVRGSCYSAHRELGAVAFILPVDYPKPPQKSVNEQDNKMDQCNDHVSVLSGSTTFYASTEVSVSTAVSSKSLQWPRWWPKGAQEKQERREQEEREAIGHRVVAEQREEERRESINEAVEFLEQFVRNRWPNNFENGQVKIHCDLTMDEIEEIGRMNKVDGTQQCRDLFTAPFIHDAMGRALYEILSAQFPKEGLDMITEEEDAVLMTEEDLAIGSVPSRTADRKMEKRKRGGSLPLDDRRTRSIPRRATEGDVIPVVRRSSSTRAITMSERDRRKSVSGEVLVRPDQVLCTTCGSRAMGTTAEDEAMAMDEDEGMDEERHSDKKRMSLSRRISVKMGEKLTAIGGDVASGYGGSRLMV
ncbi:hypothetical protein CkaCkLH20_11579 [Colletotrichum karsti]|uniref:Uncharacterized protein n=1 Tax=Colletotrichum karsti TaxID=1095194 RepID=A0A9P6HVU5_9PEZI|nr:uncharacterized protein CkaCkLH20_11579 [Colletotrichum karsti]KAF9870907.1 hypothetical protein CkaCkLH20_11579 [Colletotrichum karsti]